MASLRLAEELMGGVAALRRVVRRRLRGTVPGPALSGAQLELLRFVETEPGTGVAAAARALRLAGNSVSTLVNQLVARGLLDREVDPADRRAVRLVLTDAAASRLAAWRAARSELVGAALDRLPADDRAAVRAALPALRRLLAELEEER
ncbi:MarR family winged helix-turn-helix transcriptional regulator [Pseudonocardia acaciae]|uniref:MarR family winged helix-turn-helix transcriptional regulator n=1 Tax=Pseudonocardia acaciae TaxID=551276 RepID=UPI00048B493A|nr:MarR family transcriptional regulator [Pseudonocardia acaciae]